MCMLLSYPASIEKQPGGFCVSFRDLPNIESFGTTVFEAMQDAYDLLEIILEGMIKNKEDFNLPSPRQEREISIPIPEHLLKTIAARYVLQ